MSMTPEDKAIISEYMGWCNHKYAKSGKLWGTGICIKCKDPLPLNHHFDSNDASLCVEKMRNTPSDEFISDWHDFFYFACPANVVTSQVTQFFMNADNFFQAMAAWLRSK